MEAIPHSQQWERLQKRAVGRVHSYRCSHSREEFLENCAALCTNEGLAYNKVRAIVWADLVLKEANPPTKVGSLPYICETAIVKQRGAANGNRSGARLTLHGVGSEDDEVGSEALDGGSFSSCVSSSSTFAGMVVSDNCQVRVLEADLLRSLWTLYPVESTRNRMRARLRDMILRILASHPDRHYYQGLHELMGHVMYVASPYVASEVVVSLCEGLLLTRWRSFSEHSLRETESLLYALHAVLVEEDQELAVELERCGVAPESHYAVSWVITWYAHSVSSVDTVSRLFDYFLVGREGHNVIYFSAALLATERERVLGWVREAQEELKAVGADGGELVTMARVYSSLTSLPHAALDKASDEYVNAVIARAEDLRRRFAGVVEHESRNYMDGKVEKLGMLADQRTRNSALRLLWSLLPREWRSPARQQRLTRMLALLTAGALTVATAMAFTKGKGGL